MMSITSVAAFLDRWIHRLGYFLNLLGVISLFAMMLLTVADVFLRYFFKRPIIGGTELTQGFMICMVLGLGWSAIQGKGIKMDMLVQRLSMKKQLMIDSATIFLGLVVLLPITLSFISEISVIKKLMMKTAMLGIPEYLFYIVMAVGFGYLVLVMCILVIKQIAKAVSNES